MSQVFSLDFLINDSRASFLAGPFSPISQFQVLKSMRSRKPWIGFLAFLKCLKHRKLETQCVLVIQRHSFLFLFSKILPVSQSNLCMFFQVRRRNTVWINSASLHFNNFRVIRKRDAIQELTCITFHPTSMIYPFILSRCHVLCNTVEGWENGLLSDMAFVSYKLNLIS